MQKVFLILSSTKIGGAEKRFVGLWQSFCESNTGFTVMLVISPALYTNLQHQEEYGDILLQFEKRVLQWDLSGKFREFRAKMKAFIPVHTKKGDILHFIGDHPLIPLSGRRQFYSITQSSLKNLNNRGKIGTLLGTMLSDKIDILDPNIFRQIKKFFLWKKGRLFLTSNSFCDPALFTAGAYSEKKDWLVFLGRFEPLKQADRLLDALPSIYKAIHSTAKNDLHFYLLGHGSLEQQLKEKLKEGKFKNLPVTISFNEHPSAILAKSKVFFSLQWHNNYPSVSLIEAMAAGNIPLVTDVGQTRWLARPEFSYYVPEHFSESDLVNAVLNIYEEDSAILEQKSVMARQFILDNHTLEKMRDYYLSLYAAC